MQFKKETYANQVYVYLTELIRRGDLKAGDAVKEAFIATKLGISRAPIREALQELLHQGLLTSEPQKGKFVHTLTKKEIIDSYALAGILEAVAVVESLPKWTAQNMRELNQLVATSQKICQTAPNEVDLPAFDDVFHQTLLQHCDNDKLVSMARMSCVTISKILMYKDWLQLYSPQEFLRRHAILADAMNTRQPDDITHALRQHYADVGVGMAACCPN